MVLDQLVVAWLLSKTLLLLAAECPHVTGNHGIYAQSSHNTCRYKASNSYRYRHIAVTRQPTLFLIAGRPVGFWEGDPLQTRVVNWSGLSRRGREERRGSDLLTCKFLL